ncbi:lipoprotein-releasing ABC transporter permease subunit [Pelagibacteraceae bacterium]|nr:lipoprotein-releasing ABC transporter permease subunit [Pelagibacteraceae bacterium]
MFTSAERLIALRNLKPKRKEGFLKVISIFSFVGIMLGVAILIIVMSVMNGFRTELTNKILGFNPHVVIKPYNNEKITPIFKTQLNKNFPNIQILESYSGEGVVINDDYAKGIMIKGLDPANERNSLFLKKILIEGEKNKIRKGEIVIGKELAIELNLSVGDKINLLSSAYISTPFGSLPKQETYIIKGIFSSGFYEFDKNVIFLNLEETLQFFGKNNNDINLEVYLLNPLKANEVKDEIGIMNNNFYVYSWIDLNKSFFSALKVERNVMFIILTLIIIVAAFNIISGLTILIKNKTKEIAILKTLGLGNKSIIKSFFLTGFTIGLIASIFGIIIGILFAENIEAIRLFLSYVFNVEIFPSDVYFLDKMPSEIDSSSVMIIFIFSLAITSLASLIPAISISKMNTIKALKYE